MSRKITVALMWTPDIDGIVDFKSACEEVEKVFPEKFDFRFIGTNGIIDDHRNAHEILRNGSLYMNRGEWTINSSDAVSSFSAFCNNRISRTDYFIVFTGQLMDTEKEESFEYHSSNIALVTFRDASTTFERDNLAAFSIKHVLGHFLGVREHCDNIYTCVMSKKDRNNPMNGINYPSYDGTLCYCDACLAKIQKRIEIY
jgi:hypothetical protein